MRFLEEANILTEETAKAATELADIRNRYAHAQFRSSKTLKNNSDREVHKVSEVLPRFYLIGALA